MRQPSSTTDKLAELMLLIAERCEGQKFFGKIKLNKLCFYSDFSAYAKLGRPITDASYVRRPMGPVPKEGEAAYQLLLSSGAAHVVLDPILTYSQGRLIPHRSAEVDWLSPEQALVVADVCNYFRDYSGTQISDESHNFMGWIIAKEGEAIPYDTVHLPPRGQDPDLDADELAWATATAESLQKE